MTRFRPSTPNVIDHEELLHFVDGALDDDGRVRVLTHLAAHPDAVERVEAYLQQNARLRALRDSLTLPDSHSFAAPLQAALAARLAEHPSNDRSGRSWRRYGIAAAVALVVAAGVAGFLRDVHLTSSLRTGTTTAASSPVVQPYFPFDKAELATASIEEAVAAEPLDDDVFDWLAGHVGDFSLSPPDLDTIGLELVGGETLDDKQTPAIRILYRDAAGSPVVLYAGIGQADAEHAFWLVREGYLSLQWRRGPMIFAVVAATDSPQLSAIVELVGAAVARMPPPEQIEQTQSPAEPPVMSGAIEQTGPLQAIAVPLARPDAAGEDQQPSDATITREHLQDAEEANQPESL